MRTYAFVFARGGSKGVPGKNIRELAGKPLLKYSIEQAKEIDAVNKVFVSTEDPDIAAVARDSGAEVINRPKKLAQDDTPEWLAWQHAIKWLQDRGDHFDVFLSLPTTSPLRNKEDVKKCLNKLDDGFNFVITITETNRSPWFNMVQRSDNGTLSLLMEGNKSYSRRQDVPKAYDMTTVAYVTRPEFIINNKKIWNGRVCGVKIPPERALDIDIELDWDFVEYMISKSGENN